LIGCVQGDCFGLLVTLAPVVEADNESADARQDNTAGLTDCENGDYERSVGFSGAHPARGPSLDLLSC